MIKKDFLQLIESQDFCIDSILHELLQVPTYKEFFGRKKIGVKHTDFRPQGDKGWSPKVQEFVDKHINSASIAGPIQFFEYLAHHKSDNVLKTVLIEAYVQDKSSTLGAIDSFKEELKQFKAVFFGEENIPYITNLTSNLLSDTTYMPVMGREKELAEIKRQFHKLMKNNVVLTGNGGVGKTALVEEFALAHKLDYTVFELNVLGLIGEGKKAPSVLNNILETICGLAGEKVLFVDEFHILVKEGLADDIKRLTSRKMDMKFIVATTHDEFRKFVEKDKALERRFTPIPVNQIEGEVLINVLTAWADKLKEYTGIDYDQSIVKFTIDKMKVERQKTSPDKEKDIIDAAFAGVAIQGGTKVSNDDIADVMSMRLSIPKKQLTSTMFDVIGSLGDNLKKEIKGQDYAINNVVKVMEAALMRKKKTKAMAVMFFAGPTSVGKTELAKQLAKNLFGSESNLIHINCTDYKEKHTVSSLLGSPPGYVDSEAGGKLVNDIRKKPFSVILFDEFDKAHPDVHDIMLPMFDEGIVTDRSGTVADVTNCVIILTSNTGAEHDSNKSKATPSPKAGAINRLGFARMNSEEEYEATQGENTERYKKYLSSLNKNLKPELLSRITEIVVFSNLSPEIIKEIITKQLDDLVVEYKEDYDFTITYSDEIIEYINTKSGKNPRRIAATIDKNIRSAITRAYTRQKIKDGDEFEIILLDKVIALDVVIDE